MATIISNLGFNGTQLPDFSPATLGGFDVLWLVDNSNSSAWGAATSNITVIADFVSNGGTLFFNDRSLDNNTFTQAYLSGLGAGVLVQAPIGVFNDTTVTPPGSHPIVNGPFGLITNTNLDGGNFTFHGAVTRTSIDAFGATPLLQNAANAEHVGSFVYSLGSGQIVYDRMPMGAYLAGFGTSSHRNTLFGIYAPNVLAALAVIPEPSRAILLMAGGLLLIAQRRRPVVTN